MSSYIVFKDHLLTHRTVPENRSHLISHPRVVLSLLGPFYIGRTINRLLLEGGIAFRLCTERYVMLVIIDISLEPNLISGPISDLFGNMGNCGTGGVDGVDALLSVLGGVEDF